ncbi:hypothetical protein TREAZ_0791 [Leadbettera azotonutricia ZAS-9]|uniref:Uncharacterized protein n=1 Tax=Leadbettera azotonutricia (strain ATCC BAA-888 / DSM 13862 / ZAS-9) TaxID=545695 RepID=F5Y9N9_LEAAZ|nr:hypothetical protein TREAZ_0791 [Leadbettera azotonutricia ZAS-9]
MELKKIDEYKAAQTASNKIVYASPPVGGSASTKPQSAQ